MSKTSRDTQWLIALVLTAALPGCDSEPTAPTPGGTMVSGVTVMVSSNSILIPATVQATAVVAPATAPQTVTWASSDPLIAAVSSTGLITPMGPGSVTITAASTADANQSGSVTLGVQCPEPRLVTSNITVDETWENWIAAPGCFDYVVQTDLSTNDEVLTIEPGTVVGFEADRQLRVRSDAQLLADGTVADPIVLKGTTPQRGFWKGLALEGRTQEHVVTHTTIQHTSGVAVSQSQPAGLIVSVDVRVRLENSVVSESSGYGIFLGRDVDVTGVGNNTFTANAMGPAYSYAQEVTHLWQGTANLTGNDTDVVTVFPRRIDGANEWGAAEYRVVFRPGFPFKVYGTLTLRPGAVLRFVGEQVIQVLAGGALIAVGTAEEPIVLSSTGAGATWWGLEFVGSDSPQNRLDYVVVENAGLRPIGTLPGANLTLRNGVVPSSITMSNTTLRNSAGFGLYVHAGSRLLGFSGNTLTANQVAPAYVSAKAVGDILPGNDFTGNAADEIQVEIGTPHTLDEDATWNDHGVPYWLRPLHGIITRVVATWTIAAGVDIQLDDGVGLQMWMGGSLVAIGTTDNIITFDARPGGGLWRGLSFHEAQGTLEWVSVINAGSNEYGGVNAKGAIVVTTANAQPPSSSVSLSNTTLAGLDADIVFGFHDTFVFGCVGSVWVGFLDSVSNHCK